MKQWTEIRRKVLVERVSKREVCRDYHIAFETLQRILAHPAPPGYQMAAPRPKTKVGPYVAVIDAILEADREAPPKQRHTAKRIFEAPEQPYTRALMAAAFDIEVVEQEAVRT